MSQISTAAVDSTETIIEPAPDSEAEVPTVRLNRGVTAAAPESEAVLTPIADTRPSTDHKVGFVGEFGDGAVAPCFDGEPVAEGEVASLELFEIPGSANLQ